MSAPVLEREAAYVYQQLQPMALQDAANGYALAHLCAVLMKPVEIVSKLAREVGDRPGYADALDLDRAPAQLLPWLGQFNGTALSEAEPETAAEEQRRKIREARGSHRGQPGALVSDLAAVLTGAKTVQLIERDGNPFVNRFVVHEDELPDEHVAAATLKDRTTKPLGTVNHLQIGTPSVWADATRRWSAIASGLTWASATGEQI